eukprot:TRINITY_DN4069_c0_g1_i4.p1 TRINITY_DN4069_c0_g1~~TRINITY_DN4069_c0_g1_i4.p1  ORF type:complete len:781 (+),score=168.04 TRINITY_DN4069_c0_g1_i4:44-2344(+)
MRRWRCRNSVYLAVIPHLAHGLLAVQHKLSGGSLPDAVSALQSVASAPLEPAGPQAVTASALDVEASASPAPLPAVPASEGSASFAAQTLFAPAASSASVSPDYSWYQQRSVREQDEFIAGLRAQAAAEASARAPAEAPAADDSWKARASSLDLEPPSQAFGTSSDSGLAEAEPAVAAASPADQATWDAQAPSPAAVSDAFDAALAGAASGDLAPTLDVRQLSPAESGEASVASSAASDVPAPADDLASIVQQSLDAQGSGRADATQFLDAGSSESDVSAAEVPEDSTAEQVNAQAQTDGTAAEAPTEAEILAFAAATTHAEPAKNEVAASDDVGGSPDVAPSGEATFADATVATSAADAVQPPSSGEATVAEATVATSAADAVQPPSSGEATLAEATVATSADDAAQPPSSGEATFAEATVATSADDAVHPSGSPAVPSFGEATFAEATVATSADDAVRPSGSPDVPSFGEATFAEAHVATSADDAVHPSAAEASVSEAATVEDQRPRRVAWFHCPKCGTSFGTTLAHYANASLPEDAHIEQAAPGVIPEKTFLNEYPVDKWFHNLLWKKAEHWGDHDGITDKVYEEFRGDFFGMFRRPRERLLSAWEHFGAGTADPQAYAVATQGVVTKMLAGQSHGLSCTWPKELHCPDSFPCQSDIRPDVDLALERLNGFKFVGLTEEYSLSVCLFHAMFGGECLPVEFDNMRPQLAPTRDDPFESFSDPYDGAIHQRVQEIFWKRIFQYDVNMETCATKYCPRAQEHFRVV